MDIGRIRRKVFELAKPNWTLTWNNSTINIYMLTERSLLAKIEAPFHIDIMLYHVDNTYIVTCPTSGVYFLQSFDVTLLNDSYLLAGS